MNIKRLWSTLARHAEPHSTAIVALLLFLTTVFLKWKGYIEVHEAMYLIGPHRVADPQLLARDLSWGRLPPTTFLYDHLLAPLWSSLGDYGIVVVGRFVFWGLTAWSLALLTRLMRLPAWSVVVGYALWLLAGQTLLDCGSPIEGVQPKAMAYPLFYFSLAFAMQGQAVRAGLAAGLATAFHIIVGGWGCFAVFCSMLLSRTFTLRKLLGFLVASSPFVVPIVVAAGLYNAGQGTAVDRALMDKIYVTFAAPHCCDLGFLMSPLTWVNTIAVFTLAPILLYLQPRDQGGMMPAHFVVVLIGIFAAGALAQVLKIYGFLKLFPFQLGGSIPLLFLFIVMLAWFGRERPKRLAERLVWVAALALGAWLMYYEEAPKELLEAPRKLELRANDPERAASYGNWKVPMKLYEWIRKETPRDSIFITPHMGEFWVCAERAQVASMRHPPLDKRIIEWGERLLAIHRNKSFKERGFDIVDGLTLAEGQLTVPELVRIRDRYGATHYLTERPRDDLLPYEVFSSGKYHVYKVADLR